MPTEEVIRVSLPNAHGPLKGGGSSSWGAIEQTTKIGISVGKQRNNADPEVAKLAKAMVAEWKKTIDAQPKKDGPAKKEAAASESACPKLQAALSTVSLRCAVVAQVPCRTKHHPAARPPSPKLPLPAPRRRPPQHPHRPLLHVATAPQRNLETDRGTPRARGSRSIS